MHTPLGRFGDWISRFLKSKYLMTDMIWGDHDYEKPKMTKKLSVETGKMEDVLVPSPTAKSENFTSSPRKFSLTSLPKEKIHFEEEK